MSLINLKVLFAIFAALLMIAVPLCAFGVGADSATSEQYESTSKIKITEDTTSDSFSTEKVGETEKTQKEILEANGGTATFTEAKGKNHAVLTLNNIKLIVKDDIALDCYKNRDGFKLEIVLIGMNSITSADQGTNTRAVAGDELIITGPGYLAAMAGSATSMGSNGIQAVSLTIAGGATIYATGGDVSSDQYESNAIYAEHITISGKGTIVVGTGGTASTSYGVYANNSLSVTNNAMLIGGVNFDPEDNKNGHGIGFVNSLVIKDSTVNAIGTTVGVCRVDTKDRTVMIEDSEMYVSGSNCAFNTEIKEGEIIKCREESGELITSVPTTVKEFDCYPASDFCIATFVTDKGTAPESQTVLHGSLLTEPESITVSGYVFAGWYVNGKLWDFDNDIITSDITLRAKWVKVDDGSAVVDTDTTGRIRIDVTPSLKELIIKNGEMSLLLGEEMLKDLKGKKVDIILRPLNDEESFEILVLADGEQATGYKEITLPFDKTKGLPRVFCETEQGDEFIPSFVSGDGLVTFGTYHNSVYVLKYDENSESSGNSALVAFGAVAISIAVLLALVALAVTTKK